MTQEVHVVDSKTPTNEEAIAQSIIPYSREDNRCRYLGLRSSGFTKREALKYLGLAESTLSFWRKDGEFVQLEGRIPEFRKTLSREYISLDFMRNFRLVLKKDYEIIKLSLTGMTMGKQDHDYLVKCRSQYTPQQLQAIEMIAGLQGGTFDFTKIVTELQGEVTKVTARVSAER